MDHTEGLHVECNPAHVIAALDSNISEREIMEATIAMYHELKL
jgi:alkylhydroperoxidase/carboxymuconolactone decarboxylase family protein YurZ